MYDSTVSGSGETGWSADTRSRVSSSACSYTSLYDGAGDAVDPEMSDNWEYNDNRDDQGEQPLLSL